MVKWCFDVVIVVVGLGLVDIVWWVICVGEGLLVVEKMMGWLVCVGWVVLILVFDWLVGYYGLK